MISTCTCITRISSCFLTSLFVNFLRRMLFQAHSVCLAIEIGSALSFFPLILQLISRPQDSELINALIFIFPNSSASYSSPFIHVSHVNSYRKLFQALGVRWIEFWVSFTSETNVEEVFSPNCDLNCDNCHTGFSVTKGCECVTQVMIYHLTIIKGYVIIQLRGP